MRFLLVVLFGFALLLPQVSQAQSELPASYPQHMAALGDSITRAANADIHSDHPVYSWSTGGRINSHATLLRQFNPTMPATNAAVSGTRMRDLLSQVETLSPTVDYVTILMGGNDLCGPTEAQMTPVVNYRLQFAAGMAALSARLPDARIFVASNPNVLGLWEALHNDPNAQAAWSRDDRCAVMLANPTSMEPEDVARRQRVQQRALDYNVQLVEICAQYIHCRYEGGFLTTTPVEPSSASTLDYYHPSVVGQERLSLQTFQYTFHFTDTVAPVTTLSSVISNTGYQVTLSASDNVGVAGIEYRLNNGNWKRYTSPLTVPFSARLAYRAVDINGVNEPTRFIQRQTVFLPFIHKN